jgi:hypothetical protein
MTVDRSVPHLDIKEDPPSGIQVRGREVPCLPFQGTNHLVEGLNGGPSNPAGAVADMSTVTDTGPAPITPKPRTVSGSRFGMNVCNFFVER